MRIPVTFTVEVQALNQARGVGTFTDAQLHTMMQEAVDNVLRNVSPAKARKVEGHLTPDDGVCFLWRDVCEFAEVLQPGVEQPRGKKVKIAVNGRDRVAFRYVDCVEFLSRRFVRREKCVVAARALVAMVRAYGVDPLAALPASARSFVEATKG